jgi:hypothetical protein
METPIRRARRWAPAALAIGCGVLSWFVGFLSGRRDGFDVGEIEGAIVARAEGVAEGRRAAVDEAIEGNGHEEPYEEAYPLHRLAPNRFGPPSQPSRYTVTPSPTPVNNETYRILLEEIRRDIAPMLDDPNADGPVRVTSDPNRWAVIVHAPERFHYELLVYLKSKEDYLSWKLAEESALPVGRSSKPSNE